MSFLAAIGGIPNSGKSYSRTTIKKGEECFVISSSPKALYLKTSKGKNIEHIKINRPGKTMGESLKEMNISHPITLMASLLNSNTSLEKAGLEVSGNYCTVDDISHAEVALKFVSNYMPQIKVVIFPDFTHFVTDKITSLEFRNRNSGGDAFGRYLDLGADTFNTFFKSAKQTRKDLIQIIEFHLDYDEVERSYKIYSPGGKLLQEKLKPDSYFDVFLISHFIDEDEDPKLPFTERFKFITRRYRRFNARSLGGMFDPETEVMIPNDLQMVIDKIREHQQI